MEQHQSIQIPFSKSKVLALVLGATLFVLLGLWLITLDTTKFHGFGPFRNPLLIRGTGIASIAFFGACAVIGLMKLFDSKPGLVISQDGIIDNSSGVSAGYIPWSRVIGVSEFTVLNQRFVGIVVNNPEEYLNRGNALQRKANQVNMKMFGTAINISSNALKIQFDELVRVLQDAYKTYGANA